MHSPSPCRPLSLSLRRGVSGTGMNGPWTRPIDRWNNSFRASVSPPKNLWHATFNVINNCLIIPYSLNFPLVSPNDASLRKIERTNRSNHFNALSKIQKIHNWNLSWIFVNRWKLFDREEIIQREIFNSKRKEKKIKKSILEKGTKTSSSITN